MNETSKIDHEIASAESELENLDTKRAELLAEISSLKAQRDQLLTGNASPGEPLVTGLSSGQEKIRLFRSLFRGREDVFPRRFESKKTGKSGYQPCCRKEWIKGLCRKPNIRCHDCECRDLVLGNQIYVEKQILPPALKNRLIRLAAFQNPEFYRAQAMRFPTFDKPRIINCCEDFPKYIGIPRGCLEEVISLLESFGIRTVLKDERFEGRQIDIRFQGFLWSDQDKAVEALSRHDTGVLSASIL